MQSNSTTPRKRQPSETRACLQCGGLFQASAWSIRNGRGKFCGRGCFAAHRDRSVEATCLQCGAAFVEVNARVKNNRGKYCSKRCADEAKVRIADPVSHFWKHVVQTSECWQWSDVVSPFGYGVIHYRKTIILIHRLSWEIHNGDIPAGLCILHQCDNPPCSNPSHLFLGTKATNNRDRADKGRGAIGSLAGSAKLTEDDVRDIRLRCTSARKRPPAKKLAAEFGVNEGTIYAAIRGDTWKHVE